MLILLMACTTLHREVLQNARVAQPTGPVLQGAPLEAGDLAGTAWLERGLGREPTWSRDDNAAGQGELLVDGGLALRLGTGHRELGGALQASMVSGPTSLRASELKEVRLHPGLPRWRDNRWLLGGTLAGRSRFGGEHARFGGDWQLGLQRALVEQSTTTEIDYLGGADETISSLELDRVWVPHAATGTSLAVLPGRWTLELGMLAQVHPFFPGHMSQDEICGEACDEGFRPWRLEPVLTAHHGASWSRDEHLSVGVSGWLHLLAPEDLLRAAPAGARASVTLAY
jgi:hypothetical protein